MTNVIKKDVFISYKDKGEGREFSIRLSKCLKEAGYQVYFNPDEKHSGHFDEEIREAVLNCKDLILVLDNAALKQLIRCGELILFGVETDFIILSAAFF